MNKIDYGYYDIELGNYNIVSVVEDITMSVLEYIKNKGIELIFDTDTEEEIIACDPDKIERIILNLLSNAIKYTNKGKISIYSLENKKLVIEDTGIGISKEDIPRIFDKGFTGYNGRTDKKATGLGLYLCKNILDKLSHKISIESEVGVKTKVILDLSMLNVNIE